MKKNSIEKRLTEKQRNFARLIASNKGSKTNTQCAIEAGYSPNRARQEASELQNPIKNPSVVKYIEELRETISEYLKRISVVEEKK
ncbi:MAG: terminase small subunit [bacterium]|nr:terminase small subunit [bacterium]